MANFGIEGCFKIFQASYGTSHECVIDLVKVSQTIAGYGDVHKILKTTDCSRQLIVPVMLYDIKTCSTIRYSNKATSRKVSEDVQTERTSHFRLQSLLSRPILFPSAITAIKHFRVILH